MVDDIVRLLTERYREKEGEALGASGGPECDAEGGARDMLWDVLGYLHDLNYDTPATRDGWHALRGIDLPDVEIVS
jgi:hypothetical protein